jgi:hypothetical protein
MSLYLHDQADPETHRVVTVHTAGCKHARPRKSAVNSGSDVIRWHGPFRTLDEAHIKLGSFTGLVERRVHYCVVRGLA